jgi:hypothetical protein
MAEREGVEPSRPFPARSVSNRVQSPICLPFQYVVAEAERFELPDAFAPTIFKTAAFNQTRPRFLFETWEFWTAALRLGQFPSRKTVTRSFRVRASRVSAGSEGLEPSTDVGSEPTALPIELRPSKFSVARDGFAPPTRWASTNCSTRLSYLAMAERVGFEPTEPCGSPTFEAGAFSRTQPPLHCASFPFELTVRIELTSLLITKQALFQLSYASTETSSGIEPHAPKGPGLQPGMDPSPPCSSWWEIVESNHAVPKERGLQPPGNTSCAIPPVSRFSKVFRAGDRRRTRDLKFTKLLLCRLSYTGLYFYRGSSTN